MSPTAMRIIAPLSLVLLLASASEAAVSQPRVHIELLNKLSDNKKLTIHCYERYRDDLGEWIIPPGEQHIFAFTPGTVDKPTKYYYCSVKWDGSNLNWFDLWSREKDYNACKVCKWIVNEKEACRFDYDTGAYSVCVVYRQQRMN
ncbi:S-protein homolog 29-like [Vicia villosa]|uniref:S-protein homolog 29-like n=1 Tax=Vicia villosa TaxID=3911 RepID=UPI00273C20C4|nr:S-protein homolog 29-like [Vicia villosa]